MQRRLELSYSEEWKGFNMRNQLLELPTGQLITPQQILVGIALVEIGSELEIKTNAKLLKIARCISEINELRSKI